MHACMAHAVPARSASLPSHRPCHVRAPMRPKPLTPTRTFSLPAITFSMEGGTAASTAARTLTAICRMAGGGEWDEGGRRAAAAAADGDQPNCGGAARAWRRSAPLPGRRSPSGVPAWPGGAGAGQPRRACRSERWSESQAWLSIAGSGVRSGAGGSNPTCWRCGEAGSSTQREPYFSTQVCERQGGCGWLTAAGVGLQMRIMGGGMPRGATSFDGTCPCTAAAPTAELQIQNCNLSKSAVQIPCLHAEARERRTAKGYALPRARAAPPPVQNERCRL